MGKTKYILDTEIRDPAPVTVMAHVALQKLGPGGDQVLFGKHRPDLKLVTLDFDWDIDRKTKKPVGLDGVTMSVRYSAEILISNAIDKSSKCFKLVKAHEEEHQDICVKGVKKMSGDCEKILARHTEAAVKSWKGDYVKMYDEMKKFAAAIAVPAFKEIDDGPFYRVCEDSLKIDTPAHYREIEPYCAEFG